MEMPRYCPCGTRLERKEYESQAAFENRLYCNNQHRAKYHPRKPAEHNFGIQVRKDKTKPRVGPGMLHYLYGKPV